MRDRLPHSYMADELDKLIYGKTCWLADFGAKRPEHDIETKERELAVLRQAASDYRRAAEKTA